MDQLKHTIGTDINGNHYYLDYIQQEDGTGILLVVYI